MLLLRFAASIFFAAPMVFGAAAVSGQDYPNKPIRILTSGAGGSSDILSRLIGQGISGPLGQPVIVDNRVILLSIEAVAKSLAGVNIVGIPYKSIVLALPDLMAGQVQLMFAAAGPSMQYVKSGRLRALAVTTAQQSALVPGLPTMASAGLPGYELVGLNGVLAPGKTPTAIINRLNREMVRVLARAEVKEKFIATGQEIVGSSPEVFVAAIKSDMTKMGKVIKDAGIRAD